MRLDSTQPRLEERALAGDSTSSLAERFDNTIVLTP